MENLELGFQTLDAVVSGVAARYFRVITRGESTDPYHVDSLIEPPVRTRRTTYIDPANETASGSVVGHLRMKQMLTSSVVASGDPPAVRIAWTIGVWPKFVSGSSDSLVLTGHAPGVSVAAPPVLVGPPAGALALTGHAPSTAINEIVRIAAPSGSLALAGHAPTLSTHVGKIGTSQALLEYFAIESGKVQTTQSLLEMFVLGSGKVASSQVVLEALVIELGRITASQSMMEAYVIESGLMAVSHTVIEFFVPNWKGSPGFMTLMGDTRR